MDVANPSEHICDKNKATPKSGYLERSLVLNLSPIEIAENDCHTSFGLVIKIQSKEHAITLLGKYYGIYDESQVSELGITQVIGNWKLFTNKDVENSIGKSFVFRSPITCQTKDFKICNCCFGEHKEIKSPLVGIITGQSIAERMTQLSLRTFHTSGSSSLPVNGLVVDFLTTNLKQIINIPETKHCIVILDEKINDEKYKDVLRKFKSIEGYISWSEFEKTFPKFADKYTKFKNTGLIYSNITKVQNQDVTQKITEINSLLLTQKRTKNNILNIAETYDRFMSIILDLGIIYSSFIENVFANMFINNNTPIRYLLNSDPNVVATTRLSYRHINKIVSKLLGLIYEPNSISISSFGDEHNNPKLANEANTVFERLWKGTL